MVVLVGGLVVKCLMCPFVVQVKKRERAESKREAGKRRGATRICA